jgi:hypothetical protein
MDYDTGFVAIIAAAGCNVREVSEWAGYHSVVFTLTRYYGLFEDGADAVDRLDALLEGRSLGPYGNTIRLPTRQVRGTPSHAGSGFLLVVCFIAIQLINQPLRPTLRGSGDESRYACGKLVKHLKGRSAAAQLLYFAAVWLR